MKDLAQSSELATLLMHSAGNEQELSRPHVYEGHHHPCRACRIDDAGTLHGWTPQVTKPACDAQVSNRL